MMDKIRRFIYKRGFRPGLDSIFRSPSLELHYAIEDYKKEVEEERRKNV